jgi:phosphatidylserine decarboxylase
VARLARLRQGSCQNCPHDIIDARDLKFWRNVCGYWFHEADDSFLWRNRLGLARAGLAEVVCFSLIFFVISMALLAAGTFWHWEFWLGLPVALFFWFESVYFFRDPNRLIPSDTSALLSPADGTVTDVGLVDDPDFPGGQAFKISIFLSVFNVHVNRIPRTARVKRLRYLAGSFLDARLPQASEQNEQLWIDLEEDGSARLIRVKQISGAVARRIVCWLKLGEPVIAGARFGMIKFGSRTDVLLDPGETMQVTAKVGDKVTGGVSVLLRFVGSGDEVH